MTDPTDRISSPQSTPRNRPITANIVTRSETGRQTETTMRADMIPPMVRIIRNTRTRLHRLSIWPTSTHRSTVRIPLTSLTHGMPTDPRMNMSQAMSSARQQTTEKQRSGTMRSSSWSCRFSRHRQRQQLQQQAEADPAALPEAT